MLKYLINHIPKSSPYNRRPGLSMSALYVTIHSTGNLNSTARDERAWLTNPSNFRVASWHICVDEKEAIEAIPLNEVAYHAGNHAGNYSSIGIEICESGNRTKTLENAVELTVELLQQYGWGVDKLRRHYDWSGKVCPRIMSGNNWAGWEQFKAEVSQKLQGGEGMFKDIDQAMYPSIIEKAANLGLIAGYSDGTFRPKEPVTREQLIYFLLRYRERDLHQNTIADLVARWKNSIVLITKARASGGLAFGSGSFIDDKGTILTNKHVTDGYSKLTVKVYGQYLREAEFITDSAGMEDQGGLVDLALIRVQTSQPTTPVKIAKENPAHGEFCVVMGAPLVLEDSATFGIVSHDKRGQNIQVDAAVNPGNSGGACFDMAGNMIGVPTSKFVGDNIDNIAYLTSAKTVREFLEKVNFKI
ncbi:MAG: trypsin-like peptidase domain-containing protein [Dehalococcoidales bacterium]|nr:trypsin-like peptidase domain-containing protein [Dehalococcoidales bacterium]